MARGAAIRRMRVTKARSMGFTLVELMVTVAVLAIVAGIAAPSFRSMISHNRLVAGANEMIAALQLARAEAISRRATTSLCASSNGQGCTGGAGSQWVVLATKGGAPVVLRSVSLNPKLAVVPSHNMAGNNGRISFTPGGFVQVGAHNSGTFSLCASDLSGDNAVDVSAVSVRITSARRAAGSGCSVPGDL